ncbi:unnamed protein product [Symbiodinium sp. CCMP2592]|nr:unnamed protein product [Symbiodinium sp. CCMP2592]
MDSEFPPGHSIEEAVELLRVAAFRFHCLETRLETLENFVSEFRSVQERINTIALRLDSLERDLAVVQQAFTSPQGVSLRAELEGISLSLSSVIEVVNRLEPETTRILHWRERFTGSLQEELSRIGNMLSGQSASSAASSVPVVADTGTVTPGDSSTFVPPTAPVSAGHQICLRLLLRNLLQLQAGNSLPQVVICPLLRDSPVVPLEPVPLLLQATSQQVRPGLTLQQSLHQEQFARVLLIWVLVRPLVLSFSPILQDLASSVNAPELELGLLRTVTETTALRYLQVVHKFLQQLHTLWQLTWDTASQSAVVDCILSLRRDHQDCHRINCVKALRWITKLLRLQVDNLYDGLFRPLVAVSIHDPFDTIRGDDSCYSDVRCIVNS